MEHIATNEEMEITGKMDFIVPLKQIGLITRAVLEAISQFYKPRRIIVVSSKVEGPILLSLIRFWKVCKVEFIDEESFFIPNFDLSLQQIISHYDKNRKGDQREPGWWIQQLIKLGAATQIKDISTYYAVWDGDLVPTRRWKLCERDAEGNIKYFIAILQKEARSVFNTTEYANCMQSLTGFSPLDPPNGGTFVAHHMIFNKHRMQEMLQLMADKTNSKVPWPILIMSSSRRFFRFSEYKTYATFMLRKHASDFHHHDLQHFGEGGLRFREANLVISEMLSQCPLSNGGLSYSQVRDFMLSKWCGLSGETKPAYVQLDHVYGLSGMDLNLSSPPPVVVAMRGTPTETDESIGATTSADMSSSSDSDSSPICDYDIDNDNEENETDEKDNNSNKNNNNNDLPMDPPARFPCQIFGDNAISTYRVNIRKKLYKLKNNNNNDSNNNSDLNSPATTTTKSRSNTSPDRYASIIDGYQSDNMMEINKTIITTTITTTTVVDTSKIKRSWFSLK